MKVLVNHCYLKKGSILSAGEPFMKLIGSFQPFQQIAAFKSSRLSKYPVKCEKRQSHICKTTCFKKTFFARVTAAFVGCFIRLSRTSWLVVVNHDAINNKQTDWKVSRCTFKVNAAGVCWSLQRMVFWLDSFERQTCLPLNFQALLWVS